MFTTPTRHRGIAALAAAVLLLATACGSAGDDDAADDGVASLSDQDDADSDESADTEASDGEAAADPEQVEAPDNPEDAFALFEECMADAGLDMQPVDGDDGSVQVLGDDDGQAGGIAIGGSIDDFDPDQFEEIAGRCEAHLANLDAGFEMSPEQEAAFNDAQLEWTECMREQGVEVPDFDGGSGGMIVIGGPEAEGDPQAGGSIGDADFDFEAFSAADEACNHVFADFEAPTAEVDK